MTMFHPLAMGQPRRYQDCWCTLHHRQDGGRCKPHQKTQPSEGQQGAERKSADALLVIAPASKASLGFTRTDTGRMRPTDQCARRVVSTAMSKPRSGDFKSA